MNNRKVFGLFGLWFAFCATLAVVSTGFVCWAIYRLIIHFTG